MNREIKFRVFDNVDYMSNPFSLQDLQNNKIAFVEGLPIMQFTGLCDKNGVEIYEGDICRGHSDGIGTIEWTNFDGGYNYKFEDGNIVGVWEVLPDIEIIGNIHQNYKK